MARHGIERGFTLVELAIVMTIIGLLIGGILKGQELMTNARVTSTIAQVRAYEAATTIFRDGYAALPGDMLQASVRLKNCNALCDPGAQGGDSIIGSPTWSAGWASQAQFPNGGTAPGRETVLFWKHLLEADLISTPFGALVATQHSWGVTHPEAKIGGGFIVGHADGLNNPPGGATTTTRPTGIQIALALAPAQALNTVAGQNPVSAGRAALIDRKMDDGRPASGFVHAYGVTASCLTAVGSPQYNEATTGNDCGLMFRIQG